MRPGKFLKGLVAISDAVGATTGSLRQSGVKVPAGLEKLEEKAAVLAQAGAVLSEHGGRLKEFDDFIDRAAMLNARVQLHMLADDGTDLETPLVLDPILVDAMDALLDRLNPD